MSEQSTGATATATEDTGTEQLQPDLKPTETVEFWKAKAREQEKRAKENAGAQQRLSDLEAANLSEIEKAQKTANDATARLAEYERTTLRQKVALEQGIPAKWVDRLRGDTEEELAADATAILADLAPAPTSSGTYVAGEGYNPSNPNNPDAQARAILGF